MYLSISGDYIPIFIKKKNIEKHFALVILKREIPGDVAIKSDRTKKKKIKIINEILRNPVKYLHN